MRERCEILPKKSEQSGLKEWPTEQMAISLAVKVDSSKSEHDSIVDVHSHGSKCGKECSMTHEIPQRTFSNGDFFSANMSDIFGDCRSNEVNVTCT